MIHPSIPPSLHPSILPLALTAGGPSPGLFMSGNISHQSGFLMWEEPQLATKGVWPCRPCCASLCACVVFTFLIHPLQSSLACIRLIAPTGSFYSSFFNVITQTRQIAVKISSPEYFFRRIITIFSEADYNFLQHLCVCVQ